MRFFFLDLDLEKIIRVRVDTGVRLRQSLRVLGMQGFAVPLLRGCDESINCDNYLKGDTNPGAGIATADENKGGLAESLLEHVVRQAATYLAQADLTSWGQAAREIVSVEKVCADYAYYLEALRATRVHELICGPEDVEIFLTSARLCAGVIAGCPVGPMDLALKYGRSNPAQYLVDVYEHMRRTMKQGAPAGQLGVTD